MTQHIIEFRELGVDILTYFLFPKIAAFQFRNVTYMSPGAQNEFITAIGQNAKQFIY